MNVDAFQRILSEKCGLDRNKLLLVGVSGGPDSLCLLDVLNQLGYPMVVGHYDHCLRPESGSEAGQVRRMAEERNLPFILGKGNVDEEARTIGLSIEETARQMRYQFLFEQARDVNAQAVVVAHSADDQVETVLMHILRGAGMAGLKGMTYLSILPQWDQVIPLVRPFLGIWRDEIEDYIRERGLSPLLDPSNAERTFFRNRLRLDLIPYLEQYNPQIKPSLWRMADLLAAEHVVLEHEVDRVWEECLISAGTDWIVLSHASLIRLSIGLQRAVLRRAAGHLLAGVRDLEYQTVERALAFLDTPSTSRWIDWSAKLRLELNGDRLLIARGFDLANPEEFPQVDDGTEYILSVPGEVEMLNGWSLEAQWCTHTWADDADAEAAWLDASQLTLPFVVRSRRVGERFQPFGMDGHSLKLSDFMINEHMPRLARRCWPLVISGNQVAWIPGYRPAHFCRVTSQTQQVIFLKLHRPA